MQLSSWPILSFSFSHQKINAAEHAAIRGVLKFSVALIGFVLLFAAISESYAGSKLMVTPKRIVFAKNMRSAQVTIMNLGDTAGTYRISLTNKRMSMEGRLENAASARPGDLFADKIIRFSPRQVVLEPGQSQVVRLGLRKPSGLKEGEYRSHMLFRAIPLDAGKNVEEIVKPKSGVSVSLKAIVGISIPVIVRHGKTDAEVSIISASFVPRQVKEDRPHIVMELERKGNRSVYGDFLAEFIAKDGTRNVVAQVNGVAIYTPGTKRRFNLPIKTPPELVLVNGTIQVFYRSPAEQGGKIMAQTQIKIP